MKRIPIVVSQEEKFKFLKRNKKKAKNAFEGYYPDKKIFVNKLREKFGYSKNTIDSDILASFERVWKRMNE